MTEQTLILIKPDGVERNLIGEIIKRFEDNNLKIKNMKMLNPPKNIIEKHYPSEDSYLISLGKNSLKAGENITNFKKQGIMIINSLRNYLTQGNIVAMILEGENAITKVRKITGYTDPAKAEKGTIRGDFGQDSILKANSENRCAKNLIHASGNKEEAEKEIKLWFNEI